MDHCIRSLTRNLTSTGFLAILLSSFIFTFTEAYDAQDPYGNITIKWEVITQYSDGYRARVTLYNFQKYRHVPPPGWILSWTWEQQEVIWVTWGGLTTEQGDCSKYKKNASIVPECCMKTPTIMDLSPAAPYNQSLDPNNYTSSFQISVGLAGTSYNTIKPPKNFTLLAPGPGYTCGPSVVGKPTKFITRNGRRIAMMTWNVTCTYSQFLAAKPPSFNDYNGTVITCNTCTCGCRDNVNRTKSFVKNTTYSNDDNRVMPPSYAYQELPISATSRLSFSLQLVYYCNVIGFTKKNLQNFQEIKMKENKHKAFTNIFLHSSKCKDYYNL